MLLKGKPKVSTSTSQEWFSQNDQFNVYSTKTNVFYF